MILNDFIEKSRAVHGSKYDYYSVVWSGNAKDKVSIVCPTHGVFIQKAYNHFYCKSGCPACGGCARPTTESYIANARKIHNGWYSYEKTVYVRAKDKLIVTCPEHGDFEVEASAHTIGKAGCFRCMCDQFSQDRSSNTEDFVGKATAKHGDRYDYSETVYRRVHDKVSIKCRQHGSFLMQPANHLSGNGCPGCASYGYTHSKPGWLYVLSFENLTKVGITNRLPSARTKEICRDSGIAFKCIYKQKFNDGSAAQAIETTLLQELSRVYQRHEANYTGSTECFVDVDVERLLSILPQQHKGNTNGIQP